MDAQVDRATRWLSQHPEYRIVLEGHTDAIGAAHYNEDLSMRRIATEIVEPREAVA